MENDLSVALMLWAPLGLVFFSLGLQFRKDVSAQKAGKVVGLFFFLILVHPISIIYYGSRYSDVFIRNSHIISATLEHGGMSVNRCREIQNMEYGIRNTEPSPKGRSGCGFSFDRFVHTSHPPIGMQNAKFKIYDALAMDFRRAVSDLCRQFTPLEPI